jgi:hypothetical protein
MRRVLIAAALLALGSFLGLAADAFRADVATTGTVVLWFLGENVTADVRSHMAFSGSLLLGSTSTAFSASGRASGSGVGNPGTLAVDATIAFAAVGTTDSGTACSIEGGIVVTAIDSDGATSTSGKGRGRFFLLITTSAGRWIVEGDAEGVASGGFVVPEDPHSMQLEGSAVFTLSGDLLPWSPPADAASPEWPAALLDELERLSTIPEAAPAD